MTVARRAGARWGESSRPSAPLSARARAAPVCGTPTRLSGLRGLRVRRSGRVETSPLKHLPRTTVAPVAPARPVAVPPTRSAPTPRRERGRPDRDEFARSRRRRAVLRACTPVGSRGRPRRSRVWGMLCGSAARARGPDGGAPALPGPRQHRADPAAPAHAPPLRVRTTDERRPPLLAIRASAAMITKRLWRRGSKQHAASGGAAVECARAVRLGGTTFCDRAVLEPRGA